MSRSECYSLTWSSHRPLSGYRGVNISCVGPGGEGATLLLFDLMGDVCGTCHDVAHPSILQTVEDFRMPRRLYRGAKWISVDESKPAIGIEEDAFEILVSRGGGLCLHRNRESDAHFAERPRRGGTWSMNPDDVPRVPIAAESSYRRRQRCVVARSKFSQDPDEVFQGSRIYLAVDNLKDWIRWSEATIVFWDTVAMPSIRGTSKSEGELRLRRPPAQVAEDTAWLLRKMARIGPTDAPPLSHEGILLGR